jgi:iron complex outermembrane receptor protein
MPQPRHSVVGLGAEIKRTLNEGSPPRRVRASQTRRAVARIHAVPEGTAATCARRRAVNHLGGTTLMSIRFVDSRIRLAGLHAPTLVGAAVAAAIWGASPAAFAQDAGAEGSLDEVTVTGSRIVRRDLDAASPVVTVENQVFEQSSTLAVESVLNQLPQFVPANTQFNTSDVFPTATSTPGISTVSLRGLGANRTLVLIDGRRAQPANSTLVIDTNSIPSSALASVEIITGGASAVYGADALAGVTNFKLRDDFQGIDLQLRSGITEEGDGEENRVSMLLGSSLGDGRGNAMLGVEWTERGEVLAKDRDFWRAGLKDPRTNATSVARMNRWQYEPSATNQPSQAAANSAIAGVPTGYNVVRNTPFLFNDDASLFKQDLGGLGFNSGDIVNDPRYKISPSGTLIENNFDLRYSSPMERYSLFGKADFQMNDHIKAFTQVNYVNTTNRQTLQPSGAVGGFGASIPYGNEIYGPSLEVGPDGSLTGNTRAEYLPGGAYGLNCPATGGCTKSQAFPVPPELAALLNSRGANVYNNANNQATVDPITGRPVAVAGVDSNWLLGGTINFIPTRSIENTTNLYQILAGFQGDFGVGDWTWEAYASHGATRTDLDYIGFVSTRRLQALLTAPNFGRGATAAGPGSASISCTSGLPIFEQFEVSQDCINAITARYTDRTRLEQDIYEATAQGGLFELPMGEVRAAVGVTYRKNEFEYLPDVSREANSIIDIPVGAFAQANVFGKTSVKEAYGELLVPILRNVPGAQVLELELGYRYSDYDFSGGVPTWKALFSWAPVDFLRLRGGYQVANRAPNINELYLDASSAALTLRSAEPCHSQTRETFGNHPGNPNRAQVQALCEALIGNNGTPFSADPSGFTGGRADGVTLQQSSGNLNLESEEGTTYTLGFVLRSPFESPAISGLTLAVDWYRAKIEDAIATVSAQSTLDLCFNRDGTSNPTYSIDDPNGLCRNIIRDDVSGALIQINSQFQNLGTIETSGLDVDLNWRAALADIGVPLPGNLSASVSFSKLFEFEAQDFPTAPALENAGTLGSASRPALFDWRTVTTLRYNQGNWGFGLNWRHLPSIRSFNYVTDPDTTVQGADSYDIFNLTGEWQITESFGISGGIDNLFNRDPMRTGAGQVQTINAANGGGQTVLNGAATTNAQYYDVLGRRYFINLKLQF